METPASCASSRFARASAVGEQLAARARARRSCASAAGPPAARRRVSRAGPSCSPMRRHMPQHHAARRACSPATQSTNRAQLGLQRRDVELRVYVLQAVVQAGPRIASSAQTTPASFAGRRAAPPRRRRARASCPPARGRNRPGRARPAPAHRRFVVHHGGRDMSARFRALKEG